MASLRLGCVRPVRGLRAELPWGRRQAAGLDRRGQQSMLAAGWAGVVLLRGGREADGGAGEKRRELRDGRGGLALRVPRRDSSELLCALCRNGRRAAVSAQRGGGNGTERAADGGDQLGDGDKEMTLVISKDRKFHSICRSLGH